MLYSCVAQMGGPVAAEAKERALKMQSDDPGGAKALLLKADCCDHAKTLARNTMFTKPWSQLVGLSERWIVDHQDDRSQVYLPWPTDRC